MLTAYFYHKTTGLPLTDPLVTVSATLANMNKDIKLLDNVTMTPSLSFIGAFRYTFTIDPDVNYMVYYSCSDSNYIAQIDKLYIPASRGGGYAVSQSGLDAIDKKYLKETHEKVKTLEQNIPLLFNDTKSHIDIANEEIKDKIDAIEIPENDLSDLTKSLGTAQQQLTKLSEFITKEADSEKEEMKKEYEGKISELETTIDGIEAMFEEFKGMTSEEKKTLLESKENELKEITDFADEAIEYYKELKDYAKTEGQDEIKSKLKSLL